MLPTREESINLLKQHVKDDYQILHAQMVANAMQAWAEKLSADIDLWYTTGLLHDIDYYEFPSDHPLKSLEWFKQWGYPEELIHAVDAHYVGRGPAPQSTLDAALIASDELSGLMYAYSLMRPEKFNGMAVAKVKKQMKNLKFAQKVNREDIKFGVTHLAQMLGKSYDEMLDEHIALLIEVFERVG